MWQRELADQIATAVSRIDNLEFLADVIPKTTTYKQYKEKKAKETQSKGPEVEKGQRTLNGRAPDSKVNGESTEQDRPRTAENKPSISAIMNPTDSQSSFMGRPGQTGMGQMSQMGQPGQPGYHDADVEMTG